MEIYLDNAATTKPVSSILEAIKPYIESRYYNPSSLYNPAIEIRNKIEEIRSNVANFINADSKEVFFTSGSAEVNNWVVRGFDDVNCKNESVIITTHFEHSSILSALKNPTLKSDIWFCKVNNDGLINLNHLKKLLEDSNGKKILVSIIYAQNEIGVIQNIKEISTLVHSYSGILHTDATQALPYMDINVKELGIDLMSASSQKMHGLKGTGFLYKSKDIDLLPLIWGEQENKNRGGTENIIGIVALDEAIKNINYEKSKKISKLRDYFINRLVEEFGCTINGSLENRLPNNINVTFPQNITGEALLHILDMSDIYISTGSACNSKSIQPSHVLKAIGLTDEEAARTIRITLNEDITAEEIDYVIEEIGKAIRLIESE